MSALKPAEMAAAVAAEKTALPTAQQLDDQLADELAAQRRRAEGIPLTVAAVPRKKPAPAQVAALKLPVRPALPQLRYRGASLKVPASPAAQATVELVARWDMAAKQREDVVAGPAAQLPVHSAVQHFAPLGEKFGASLAYLAAELAALQLIAQLSARLSEGLAAQAPAPRLLEAKAKRNASLAALRTAEQTVNLAARKGALTP